MLKITFEDSSTLHITESATVITNKGPIQADQVFIGTFVRCGLTAFCPVSNVTTI